MYIETAVFIAFCIVSSFEELGTNAEHKKLECTVVVRDGNKPIGEFPLILDDYDPSVVLPQVLATECCFSLTDLELLTINSILSSLISPGFIIEKVKYNIYLRITKTI